MPRLGMQRIAAALGALGIAAAAFGAHGLEKIASAEQLRWWAIAVAVHLVTAPVVLVCGMNDRRLRRAGGLSLTAGICLFSGSLYAMALGAPRVLGAVTPIGGLLLISGWVLLAFPPADPKGR